MSTSYDYITSYKTKVHEEDDFTAVVYYETAVVAFDEQTITLDTGSWRTVSTQSRMNQTSREFDLAYKIQRKKGEWYINYQGKMHPFSAERMELDRKTGEVAPAEGDRGR